MMPREGPFCFRYPRIVFDGACPPDKHMAHKVQKVLEHVPKC